MATKKLASSATTVKDDPLGGCFYSCVLSASTDDTLVNRSTGVVAPTLLSAIDTYVKGSGSDDHEALTSLFNYISDVSDSGITTSLEEGSSEFTNMNGDTVLTVISSRKETMKLAMIDTTTQAMKQYYGEDNVTVTGKVMKVRHNGNDKSKRIGIFLLAFADGRRMVRLVPIYTIKEHGEETIKGGDLWSHEVTLATTPCSTGDTIIDFIATEPPTSSGSNEG